MVRRRSDLPEANRRSVAWINGDVLIEMGPAVVAVEGQTRPGLILQPVDRRGRTHQRRAPITPDDHVWPQAEMYLPVPALKNVLAATRRFLTTSMLTLTDAPPPAAS